MGAAAYESSGIFLMPAVREHWERFFAALTARRA
jgi:hypothetical protein